MKKQMKKCLAIILSAGLLAVAPMAALADGTDSDATATNILAGKTGQSMRIIGVGGVGTTNPTFDNGADTITFASVAKGYPLSKLTDGDKATPIDIYGGFSDQSDRPGVVYDLGAYYDVSQVNFYSWDDAAKGSLHAVNGVRIYATADDIGLSSTDNTDISTLIDPKNLIYSDDQKNVGSREVKLDKTVVARYVAFVMTDNEDKGGDYRASECEVYGTENTTYKPDTPSVSDPGNTDTDNTDTDNTDVDNNTDSTGTNTNTDNDVSNTPTDQEPSPNTGDAGLPVAVVTLGLAAAAGVLVWEKEKRSHK